MSRCLQVISFAGELLSNAEGLLRDGLHTSEVADGYTKAADKASVRFHFCSETADHTVLLQDCSFMCPTTFADSQNGILCWLECRRWR